MTGEYQPAPLPARRIAARRRVAVAACSLILTLVAAELLVRSQGWARNVGPSFTEWDAEDGVRLRRGLSCVRGTPEFSFRMTTNRAGYRGPEPPERVERAILFLGDSFTMGYGVDDGSEFVALLSPRLGPRWTLFNAGVGGTGNGRWIHVLERDAPALSPRLIVLQACENDFEDNLNDGLYALDEHGELMPTAPPEAGVLRALSRVVEVVPGLSSSHLVALGRHLRRPPASAGTARYGTRSGPPGVELTLRLIGRALDVCAGRGWPVLGIVCAEDEEHQRLLVDRFAQHGARAIVAPTKAARPELYFRIDGHWNAEGHAALADLVWDGLGRAPYSAVVGGSAR